jgi:hypothetical protein
MKSTRRQFLKVSAVSVAVAATTKVEAADPFAPAEPGLPERLFDKGRQHVLPIWAFDGYRPTPGIPLDRNRPAKHHYLSGS